MKWINRVCTCLMKMIQDGYFCPLMLFITIFTMADPISVPLCLAGLWMDGLTDHFTPRMVMVPLIMGMVILGIILTISTIAIYTLLADGSGVLWVGDSANFSYYSAKSLWIAGCRICFLLPNLFLPQKKISLKPEANFFVRFILKKVKSFVDPFFLQV
ncbi:hypothetical protein J2Y02_003361 [Neobacillus drentensis]|nr:hypothetical protein [Neobacillus drentensis]